MSHSLRECVAFFTGVCPILYESVSHSLRDGVIL